MTQPVVTACACTGEPKSILDEAGMPLLAVSGVCLCPYCGKNPFGVEPERLGENPTGINYDTPPSVLDAILGLPDSEGGEA